MELSNEYRRIQSCPEALPVALELMVEQSQHTDHQRFLQFALSKIADSVGARYAVVVERIAGQWQAGSPTADPLPVDLLAEALDAEQAAVQQDAAAAPLMTRGNSGQVLWVQRPTTAQLPIPQALEALAAATGVALQQVKSRQRRQRRTRRLEAILEVAAQWNQHQQLEQLLEQMAETSTQLLGAERASIFLWDRVRGELVGRPALGVAEGELRIKDDTGIVGQVVQTGEVRRVDQDRQQDSIDRTVDKQLGYQTRTLLCVPLHDHNSTILGAFEMINKVDGNFTEEDEAGLVELASHAAIALQNCQHYEQLLRSRQQVTYEAAAGIHLIGETPVINKLRSTIQRVADTDLALLVLGENGTGKEVVSRMVHYLSSRRDEPFIAVNCAALAETLLESELFGHEKGAFTDAHEARPGKFESATGGTLFLDEIGDLSLAGQAKLLRVLEEKVVVRVGGSLPIPTDARVIAATNQDLIQMVREKRFREDLYFRLNVVPLEVPPLRERVDDIMLLARHFLDNFSARARRKPPMITPAAEKRMRQHPWPGNVRELRNLMERLAYLSPEDTIQAGDLDFIMAPEHQDLTAVSMDLGLAEATKNFQVEYIRRHIEVADGNMSDAARNLGVHRSNLYRKMRQLGMKESES